MDELNALAERVLDAAFAIHREFGPGLQERFYERVLEADLVRKGTFVERQKPISIDYDGMWFENICYADLVVEKSLTVEIKSVSTLRAVDMRQLLTYLRLQDQRLGLLLNFGAAYMKDGIKRVINGY